jgi:hypothetical protein
MAVNSSKYINEIVEKLNQLTDDERMEVFSKYCRYCGTKKIPCYCAPHYDE